jgi:hypothetical protein
MLLSEVALGEVYELKKAKVSPNYMILCEFLSNVYPTTFPVCLGKKIQPYRYIKLVISPATFSLLTSFPLSFSIWINLLKESTLQKDLARIYLWRRKM